MKFSKIQNLEELMIRQKIPKVSQQANFQQRPPPPVLASQIPDQRISIQRHNMVAIQVRMPISRLGKSSITKKELRKQ